MGRARFRYATRNIITSLVYTVYIAQCVLLVCTQEQLFGMHASSFGQAGGTPSTDWSVCHNTNTSCCAMMKRERVGNYCRKKASIHSKRTETTDPWPMETKHQEDHRRMSPPSGDVFSRGFVPLMKSTPRQYVLCYLQ